MNAKRTFITCLAAYLTGWPIANAIFNRIVRHVRREALEAEGNEWRDGIADRIVDRIEDSLREGRGRAASLPSGRLIFFGDPKTVQLAISTLEEARS